jgi:hypothetical protein
MTVWLSTDTPTGLPNGPTLLDEVDGVGLDLCSKDWRSESSSRTMSTGSMTSPGPGQLGGHERLETTLHRATLAAVPRHRQVADLLQGAAELLGSGDEGQPFQGAVVVGAVAAVGSRWRR